MERRLAAIVALDLVGYSRLMARDDAGTLALVGEIDGRIIEPSVTAHHGRVVKRMGDGLLLEFASAVEAVASVVEIQRAMRERNHGIPVERVLALRIGLHVGDVISEEGDVFGHGVNVAARLEPLAEAGGICLSRAAYDHVRDRLPCHVEPCGEHALKNIARPVEVFRLVVDRPPAPTTSAVSAASAFAARPAVAVIPFANMSGDPGEDYFTDGLSEDIVTALSYWRWFPVIARNSTLVYKNNPKNAVEIGRELKAAYLVEGSARRAGGRVRITAQLVDTATGQQLWAERYDRELADVFAVQEEIAAHVVASLEPQIHRAEEQRAARKHPDNLGAWDQALRALSLLERMSQASHAEARALLERALAADPDFAYGWTLLALCHYHEILMGFTVDRRGALKASLGAAERAAELDQRCWLAHGLRGMGLLWTARDYDGALACQERAVSLNPSAPLARHFLACIHGFGGRPAEAIPHLRLALRLDPRYRFASLVLADESLCHLLLGDAASARASAESGVRMQPANVRAGQRLVAALAALGRHEEARRAAAELLRIQPDLGIDYLDATYPFRRPEDRAFFLDALRRGGVPLSQEAVPPLAARCRLDGIAVAS